MSSERPHTNILSFAVQVRRQGAAAFGEIGFEAIQRHPMTALGSRLSSPLKISFLSHL
jgi:hypothetical protein